MTTQVSSATGNVVGKLVTAPLDVLVAVLTHAFAIVKAEPLVVAAGVYAAVSAVQGGNVRDYVVAGAVALLRTVVSPAWDSVTGTAPKA